MTTSEIPYDRWLEEALRGVVRRALMHTAEYGLPGVHHFYLTFVTTAEGVELSPELRAKYPEEMTIVLQHQFWDLSVEEDRVSVTLKFRGRPSRLVVPFAAVTAFGDPSVSFGLQLKTIAVDTPAAGAGTETAGDRTPAQPASEPGTGQVIALDTFRKK
jgi:uncharacterized protein